jgi:hypothetical protein
MKLIKLYGAPMYEKRDRETASDKVENEDDVRREMEQRRR